MKIKVLGAGCKNCQTLHKIVEEILKEENITADLEYITDMTVVPVYVMSTPGLVIDDRVIHQGKPVPDKARVKELIEAVLHEQE